MTCIDAISSFLSKIWQNKRGILAISGVTLVLAVFGTCYSSGNMSPYVTSYLKYKTSSSWVTYTTSVWIFTSSNSSIGLFAILGGLLGKFVKLRRVILVGALLQSASILLTSWLIEYGYVPLIFVYGLMQGFGVGIAYPLCIKYAQLWYPNNSGLITGVAVAGFGSGSFVINFVQTVIINPNNLSPDVTIDDKDYFTQDAVLDNLPKCFRILGTIYGVLSLLGVALMTRKEPLEEQITVSSSRESEGNSEQHRRENRTQLPLDSVLVTAPLEATLDGPLYDKTNTVTSKLVSEEYLGYSGQNFTLREAILNVSFWASLLVLCCHEYVLIIISNYYKTYGQTFIQDDSFLSLVGSMSSVANALGRLAWGILMDHSSYKTSMMLLSASQGLLAVTMPLGALLGNSTLAKLFFLLWVCLLFANTGGIYVLTPSAVGKAFGMKNFGVIYGTVFCISGVTGFGLTEVVSIVLDNTSGWTYVFLVGGFGSFICQLLTTLWKMKNRRRKII
ncbi:monocarboxylate transporter 12-B-like [Symsagittifera roscoffensis]|uniref:monocarboxylate transporter 12-B-like n=1 Tax=Symsagittifera roscoffensis TaxID=84072 RepID=UPI00307CB3CA